MGRIEKYYPEGFSEHTTHDDLLLAHDDFNFRKELESLINRYSQENNSNTPDFILAEYVFDCLNAFDKATNKRTKWYK